MGGIKEHRMVIGLPRGREWADAHIGRGSWGLSQTKDSAAVTE